MRGIGRDRVWPQHRRPGLLELETAGIVETRGRKGTFVAASNPTDEAMAVAARGYGDTARALGLAKDDALRYLDAEFS